MEARCSFYDFIVYGFFAHNIAAQFFPNSSSLVSMLATFSVLAIGYVIRPLGGIVLSSWGDRYRQRPVFLGSIIVVTTATICLGLLPNFQSWGMTASILLILASTGAGMSRRSRNQAESARFR
ncbi:MFS family permease [Paraburkholderia sp. WSM4175]